MVKNPVQFYQIKVTLHHIHPLIWRRILVPSSTTLLKLHDILQIVMGWENAHLHMFKVWGLDYDNPEADETGVMGMVDEANVKLNKIIHHEGQQFSYEYDFGDSWEHTLLVEKILPAQDSLQYPMCLKGKRAGPPEDVGGVWGYENFLKAIRNPDHDEHEDYLTWIGTEFGPEVFDPHKVNERLRHMGHGRSTEALHSWSINANELSGIEINLNSPWPATREDDQREIAENLALRRDVIALLVYLRDHKITGTPSTGNLPLKAVNEICIRFANPPELEVDIGGHIYCARE